MKMESQDIFKQKKELRKKIALQKREFDADQLMTMSGDVIANLEQTDQFIRAKTVFIYYSMPGEVFTHDLIRKHVGEKVFLLPLVGKDGLYLKKYISDDRMKISGLGIHEPDGEVFVDYDKIDLVVVPGVAFDRSMNRMGYGKAYYDGILPKIKALKVAVCFDFQLLESVPNTQTDVKMDMIVCQNKIIT